jgi:spoIIIJ-associated protein
MKRIKMKGKTVDDAVKAALEVLGGKQEDAKINVIKEGKPGMLGIIGGEEAEVEVVLRGGREEDGREVLQEILNRMSFLAVAESEQAEEGVELKIKGEDLGRIIGKEGATLKSLEILVGSILSKAYGERIRASIDAGDYKLNRKKALERLAREAAEEVHNSGLEKVLPHMEAWDRRVIHMSLKDDPHVTTFSRGEGRERRLVIAPR